MAVRSLAGRGGQGNPPSRRGLAQAAAGASAGGKDLSLNRRRGHVSRIPRFQEHLKTGFTSEAVSAARFRAFAARAEQDGLPHLAARWRRLAAAKDRLAVRLLAAADQVLGLDSDLGAAVAEERFENDVLYPKIIRDLAPGEEGTAEIFRQLVAAQAEHLRDLETLRRELGASQGDVQLPPATPEPPASAAAAQL
jgi:rubrerythrin